MQVRDSDLSHRILGRAQTLCLNLTFTPLMHLLDASGMDSAISDQLGQGHPSGFPSNGIETGEQHRFRRIVNHDVHPGDLLERSDIATLPTNDSALHVVAWKMDCRNHRLRGQLGCQTLNGSDNYLLRPRIRFANRLTFDVTSKKYGLPFRIVSDRGDQFRLGLLGSQAGDAFQPALLLSF